MLKRAFCCTLVIAPFFAGSIGQAEPKRDCGPVPLGASFDQTCKISPVLPPTDTLASEHQVFFDLHQAVGFLEAYKSGRRIETDGIIGIEKVRERLHSLAAIHRWSHELKWHADFQECR